MAPPSSASILPPAGREFTPRRVETARGPIELALRPSAEGAPVLALHGGMGGWDQAVLLALAAFGPEAPPLRVLAASRPGHLGTPLGDFAGDLAAQADLYAAVLDRLGVETTLVIAVSAGGPSALEFARRHADRTSGVILVSACTGPLIAPRSLRIGLTMMRLLSRLPGPRKTPDVKVSARRAILDPERRRRLLADPEALALFRSLGESVGICTRGRLPGTISDTKFFAKMAPLQISAVVAPILAIHGDADRVVGFSHGERVAREAPRAEFLPLHGADHVAFCSDMTEIRARIARFLAESSRV